MAILVLVLWAFTAGAGFYLLVTSSPGRPVRRRLRLASNRRAQSPSLRRVFFFFKKKKKKKKKICLRRARACLGLRWRDPSGPRDGSLLPACPRRRDARDPWAPNSLVAARQAPLVPGARALAEFAHPAAGIVGLGFWLGFTLVHARVLGWIGFGLAAATACIGLAWFAANTRAARAARISRISSVVRHSPRRAARQRGRHHDHTGRADCLAPERIAPAGMAAGQCLRRRHG